jgi:prepilin-type N-terminal cleavage/methylation domain-containing protein
MLTRMRRAVTGRPDAGEESGFTLIELLVAMGIFTVLLSIFMTAVAQMSHVTVRVDNTQAGQAELSRAFSKLDHTLRYADSVNFPVLSASNNWYLEFRTSATTAAASPVCTQYQLNTVNDTLAYRTWTDGNLATLTAWSVTASRIVNTTAQQPFTLTPAGGFYRNQSVALLLITQTGTGQPQQLSTTITAVNSSADSPSNLASGATPVTSKTPVCTGISEP